MRIGHGYDVHRLTENRKLILGGVEVPYKFGLFGHSDADALIHAVIDALLGASGLGDIGKHFPDTNPEYKNISSLKLLEYVCKLLKEKNYKIENIDVTIIAQCPKLLPYIDKMKNSVSAACGIDLNQINIKATTEEGLGFTGEGKGISAHAVCLID